MSTPGRGRLLAAAALGLWMLAACERPAPAPAAPEPSGKSNGFVGHYGYLIRLPPRYTARAMFADKAKTMELVFFYPEGAPTAALKSESGYARAGVVRLEVSPRRRKEWGDSVMGLPSLREGMTRSLVKRGEKYAVSDLKLSLPGFRLDIVGATTLVQVALEGKQVLYLFTAGKDDEVLQGLLGSLREP